MIDIHIHGIGAFDTNMCLPEDILNISEGLAKEGVLGFLPTLYPSSISEMRRQMSIVSDAMERQDSGHAKILGIHIEGPFLNTSKAGALDSASFIPATLYNLESLLDGFYSIVKIITIAPELEGALRLIKSIADRGIVASLGHSEASYEDAMAAYNAGARGITHIFNAMSGFHHREPGLAGFGLMNKDIYVEVIADPFHLHNKTIELIFRLKDKDRIIIVSDAVKGSGSRFSEALRNSNGSLMGGALAIAEGLKRLESIGFNPAELLAAVYDNPLRYLGLDKDRLS